MDLKLFNTLSRQKEIFTPLAPDGKTVTMYHCGPTVYHFVHIGNLRSFLFADTLRRVLEYNGFAVKQIMNITDVGHLVSDGDDGEDKMEKGAKREGKSAKEIADFYTNAFFADLDALGIQRAEKYPKASEHIPEQIALIKTLEEKKYTYPTSDGIYFDTHAFSQYADFARLNLTGEKAGARVEENREKRNASDFALWKFSPKNTAGEKREQEWDSPWGIGFPGWHIECSAMAMKYLGETIDIHTGGVDHISVHHTNEIAQSECATGKLFSRFWLHNEFVNIGEEKMAKSGENFIRLETLKSRGIPPLAYRYFLLTAHYRTIVNFSWEALAAAQTAFQKLHKIFHEWENLVPKKNQENQENFSYKKRLQESVNDDLNTPQAIALLWEISKDSTLSLEEKKYLFLEADKILGLGFSWSEEKRKEFFEKSESEQEALSPDSLPPAVQNLLTERESARAQKNWSRADQLRDKLFDLGYKVKDEAGALRVQRT